MREETKPTDSRPLTHFNEAGRARMVDVSAKEITERRAIARGEVVMEPATLQLIREGRAKKPKKSKKKTEKTEE